MSSSIVQLASNQSPNLNLSRFLIYFSYVGTKFSGSAKQINTEVTVHNEIFNRLKKLSKQHQDVIAEFRPFLYISSRTDAGVHALKNTAAFDFNIRRVDGFETSKLCDLIKRSFNEYFTNYDIHLRILDCRHVPTNFIARHAISRSYLYRLALSKSSAKYLRELERINKVSRCLNENELFHSVYAMNFPTRDYISTFERDYLTEIREPFNKDLFIKAVKMLNGVHDFSAFTTHKGREDMMKKKKNPIKEVKVDVKFGGKQFLEGYLHNYDEQYEIIDIEVQARSFLYKMIRKMIGTCVDIANGKLPIEIIQAMFDQPEKYYDSKLVKVLTPNGLYLTDVVYDESNFDFNKQVISSKDDPDDLE